MVKPRARVARFLFVLIALAVSANFAFSQALSVAVGTSSVTIHPGDSNVPLPVTLGPSSYSGPVSVTLTGLPSGISVAPLTLSPGDSGTLQLSASPSADQEAFPPNLPQANQATSTVTVLAFAGAVQATASVALTVSLENASFSPAPDKINLPIVRIDTNGVAIVDKTTNVPGTVTISSADGQTTYLPGPASSDNTATFHLHGNSTLLMPKQAYNLKLSTSVDLLSAMGLTCPYVNGSGVSVCDKSKSYVLLANYDDKTLLRNWSAFALANAIPSGGDYLSYSSNAPSPSGTSTPMWWAPHSLFVELYINGVYEGNYQLVEAIKIDSHRVNINEMDETDTSGKALTGGYLLEIDQHLTADYYFMTPQGVPITFEDPDFTPPVPEQASYIEDYVNSAEGALYSSNYTDPTLGWRAYFDEAAAVNFYLVNDIMGNSDGGALYSSDYLYKDKNNPLLYMGPVWDFDISSGNVNYLPIFNPTVPWMQTQAPWYSKWFTDPSFKASVVQQFNALKKNGVFSSWIASINQQATMLQQSQLNNFGRWPMQGILVWPNEVAIGTYAGEVSYLTDWIKLRIAYLDDQFNNKAATVVSLAAPAETPRTGLPASLSAQVTGGSPGGTVVFTSNSALLGSGPVDGSGIATLTTDKLPAGTNTLQAIYSGNRANALSASSPVSVDVLPPLQPVTVNLAASETSALFVTTVTLTVTVVANSGSTIPTGTVAFTSNGTPLGVATLAANGTATLQTTSLPEGDNVIQASYSGDTTYSATFSNAVTVNIQLPLFTLAVDPASQTISLGQSATFTATVTPKPGFNQAINFSCSGLPAGQTCSFSPTSVTAAGGPVSTTLVISTKTLASNEDRQPVPWDGLAIGVAAALLLWPFRMRRVRLLMILAMLGAVSLGITGCGNKQPTGDSVASTTVLISVVATGGGASQTSVVALTEQR